MSLPDGRLRLPGCPRGKLTCAAHGSLGVAGLSMRDLIFVNRRTGSGRAAASEVFSYRRPRRQRGSPLARPRKALKVSE